MQLREVALEHGAVPYEGRFHYQSITAARPTIEHFGGLVPSGLPDRECELFKSTHDGSLVLSFPAAKGDDDYPRCFRKGRKWICGLQVSADARNIDDWFRVGYVKDKPAGFWLWNARRKHFMQVPERTAPRALKALDFEHIDYCIGGAALDPWDLVCLPFRPEHPGHRRWNRNAPQYAIDPATGEHATWDAVLSHCGQELDSVLPNMPNNLGITTGRDYLLHWAAWMLQQPKQHMPYLFLHGPQNSGKSTLHKALGLLMTRGVVACDRALTTEFNGECENCVLATIEERTLPKAAYARIKYLVTSPTLAIRRMRCDQYEVPNYLHFVQTSNNRDAVPLSSKERDTRVVMLFVPQPEVEIPDDQLMERLEREAPAFLHTALSLKLNKPPGRLGLFVPTTWSKQLRYGDPSELVEAIIEKLKGEWVGTAKELPNLLGAGDWPTDLREVKTILSEYSGYLAAYRIRVEYLPKIRKGWPIKLRREQHENN